MTARERLHRLVDELPAREVKLFERILADYQRRGEIDPLLLSLLTAPEDDEPLTEVEKRAVREGLDDLKRGDVIPHEEIRREFGL